MNIVDSSNLLKRLGFKILRIDEPAEEPKIATITFGMIAPALKQAGERARKLVDKKLYQHQLDVINKLEAGFNVILISGTGSGKTEAWAVYAIKNRKKVLAIYPTLALSQDQVMRLEDYYSGFGSGAVLKIESETSTRLPREKQREIRQKIAYADLVITNPAFLLSDLKRYAKHGKPFLFRFISSVDIIVFDELDYYGSSKATLLISGLAELITKYLSRKEPQICILTATLGNPEELKEFLTEINGRPTVIVRGRKNLEIILKL